MGTVSARAAASVRPGPHYPEPAGRDREPTTANGDDYGYQESGGYPSGSGYQDSGGYQAGGDMDSGGYRAGGGPDSGDYRAGGGMESGGYRAGSGGPDSGGYPSDSYGAGHYGSAGHPAPTRDEPEYKARRHRPSANDTNVGTLADFASYRGHR